MTRFHDRRSVTSAGPSARAVAYLLVLALISGHFLTPQPALAATNSVVDGLCDEAELDAELAALPSGGTLTFDCGIGYTITLTSSKTLTRAMTIDGGQRIRLSGGDTTQLFDIAANAAVTFTGIVLQDGHHTGHSDQGGGIFNHGTLTIQNSRLVNNSGFAGGAIFNEGTLHVEDSTFDDNGAYVGAALWNSGSATIVRSLIAGGSAFSAAIIGNAGTLVVANTTMTGNDAGRDGLFVNQGTATLLNVTMAGNQTDGDGPLLNNFGDTPGPLSVGNSILSHAAPAPVCAGDITPLGNTLASDDSCGFSGDGNLPATNPGLDPDGLQNNGGPTLTVALVSNSPAVDAGKASICAAAPVDGHDQRDVGRPPSNRCDIGAFESAFGRPTQPGVPSVTAGGNPNQGVFTIAWAAASDPDGDYITYILQRRDKDDAAWNTVVSGYSDTEFPFYPAAPEAQGRIRYRVRALTGVTASPWATMTLSGSVVVDRTVPRRPGFSTGRTPEYAANGGWYLGSVSVTVVPNGDPALPDGGVGSGVDPVSIPSSQIFFTSGTYTTSAFVYDRAGNRSPLARLTFSVDATPPIIGIECPDDVTVGSVAYANWIAADGHSGLASERAGRVLLDTATPGTRRMATTPVIYDNVGNSNQEGCKYNVTYPFTGFYYPVNNRPTVNRMDAGDAVEIGFALGGDQGMNVLASTPTSIPVTCNANPTDDIERTVSASASSLSYSASSGRYTYTWKTDAAWENTCRRFTLRFADGSVRVVLFAFR